MKELTTKSIRLGDVLTLKRGYDLADRDRRSGSIPIVSSSGVTGYHDTAKVRGPGVVTGRYGTLGEVFFVQDDFWPLNTSLYVQDFKGNNRRFCAYLLTSLEIGTGNVASAVPGVNRNHLHELPVHCPSLRVQERIADTLGSYDDLIDSNMRRIAILEEMARRIFEEWFVNYRFPGHEGERRTPEFGIVPKNAQEVTLDHIMDFQGGAQPPKKEWSIVPLPGHVRMIQIRDFQSGKYVSFVKDTNRLRKCSAEDVMIARYGASVARICWGLEGAYNVALVKVVPAAPAYREFLRAFLSSPRFQTLLIGMSGRTAQAGFNKSVLKSISVVVPENPEVLERFETTLSVWTRLILNLRRQNEGLREARDLLLPKLISGEIDVSSTYALKEAAE